jgi:hypothetical protein
MDDTRLPPLPLEEWEPTKDTLHLWAQVVGKTRLALMPMRNHWWNVTLYPSARGLTTRRMPVAAHNLEIEIDLVDHRLWARTTESEADFELHDGLSVADFHRHLTDTLNVVGVSVDIRAEPFGVPTTTPFPADREHASYDADAVTRFLRVLQWSADVLEEFAGLVLRQDEPRAPLLARLRPRRQQGSPASGRRRGRAPTRSPRRRTRTRSSDSASGRATESTRTPPTTPTPPPSLPSCGSRRCALGPPNGSRTETARSRSSATTT